MLLNSSLPSQPSLPWPTTENYLVQNINSAKIASSELTPFYRYNLPQIWENVGTDQCPLASTRVVEEHQFFNLPPSAFEPQCLSLVLSP